MWSRGKTENFGQLQPGYVSITESRTSLTACREGKTKTPTHPTAATALIVSTQGPQEAVDHLDGTDKYLNRPYDQQDGEEGQMPGNHVVRLFALAP